MATTTLRAYSTLQVKAVGEAGGQRTFSGIASTPSTDLGGDVMEPLGAVFTLPLPFLWLHDQKAPIGWINKATPTARGIGVEGEVAVVTEPGRLKDRVDEAWHSMRAKLVRGLSIGFRGIESVPNPRGSGTHYRKWQWLELSAVVVPMNTEASILAIKAADVWADSTPAPTRTEALADELFKAIAGFVTSRIDLQARRIDEMARRIAELESKGR